MKNFHAFKLIAVALAMLAIFTAKAFAQDTSVHIPIGDWIAAVMPVVSFVGAILLVVLAGFGIKLLPPWAQALASTALQKEGVALASQVINWGVQAVEGATKGKEIDLNVGNAIVAKAAQEAINTWPKNVVDRLGGLDGVKKFIVTQLEDHGVILPQGSTAQQVLSSVDVRAVTGPNPR